MNTFNRKSLYAALAGLGALSGMGAAEAVNLAPEGLGQALIYPYYTVRNGANGFAYNTLLSVVNTTGSAKAVKVRFLEGKNSKEVLDFNLYLSHNDVWTAGVIPTADGAGIEACAFRVADTPLGALLANSEGLPLHVVGHLRRTSWQGKEGVELLIEDAADPRGAGGS